ncbi:MAG: hypothetical protein P4L57_11135 [Rhizomicrobium sp.]|nr:hypothetical protein [Rhizomicrobium sp.]
MSRVAGAHLWTALISGAVVALCSGFAAQAASTDDQLSTLYGNTLVARDGGIVSHFWYKPDHTFTGIVPAYAYSLKGRWLRKSDGTICRDFDPPLPMVRNPDCGSILVRKLGDTLTDSSGHSETLIAGVQ